MSDTPDEMPDGTDHDETVATEAEASVQTAVLEAPAVDDVESEVSAPGNGSNGNGSNGNGSNGNGGGGPALAPGRADTKVLPVIAAAPLPPPPPWAPEAQEASTKSRRWPKVLMVLGGVLLVFVLAILVYDWTQSDNVLPGVSVDGVDVGGLSREDATDLLDENVDTALAQIVEGEGDGETHGIALVDLGVTAGVADAVDNAVAARAADADEPDGFGLQTVTGPFVRTYHRLFNKPVDVDVEMAYSVPDEMKLGWVNAIQAAMDRPPVDARIDVSTGQFQVVPSLAGRQIDTAALAQIFDDNLRTWALTSYGTDETADPISYDLPITAIPPAVTVENLGPSIFVSRAERRLYHYVGADLVRTYSVAVGTPGYPTPKGEFKIVQKRNMPTWINPAPNGWGAGMPASIGPGPSNPLGVRAMNLNASGIRIHGTTNTGSLGSAASHGCIRMSNGDIVGLFDQVEVDTRVIII